MGFWHTKDMETSVSYRQNATGYFQTKAACYFAVEMYAPGQYNNPEVSPVLTADLKGLPLPLLLTPNLIP